MTTPDVPCGCKGSRCFHEEHPNLMPQRNCKRTETARAIQKAIAADTNPAYYGEKYPGDVPVFRVVDVHDTFELAKLISLLDRIVNGGRTVYSIRAGIDAEGFKLSVNYGTWSPPIRGDE
jgi:hypothetical protein